MRIRALVHLAAVLSAFALTGCITARSGEQGETVLIQGNLGLMRMEPDLTLDPAVGVLSERGDLVGPMLGGVVQKSLAGDGLEFGLEGGFSVAWDRSRSVRRLGNIQTAVEEDVFLGDLYGGFFLDARGESMRAYVGAGPLLQYGEVQVQSIDGNVLLDEDGAVGLGTYARVGVEVRLSASTYIGLGVRWIDAELDLDRDLDDLDLDALQVFVTVTDTGWVRPYY